jgi:hypothetical protein
MVAAEETQPLLADASEASIPRRLKSKRLMILIMTAIFALGVDLGNDMSLAPQTAIFERIICRNYGLLSTGNPPVNGSDPCKSEAVQAELALVLGYKDMFEALPSILLSLPYGVLSDLWGRKPVIYLGIVGMLLGELWVRLVGKLGILRCHGSCSLYQMLTRNDCSSILAECATPSASLVDRTVQGYWGWRSGRRRDCIGHGRRRLF